MIFLCNKMPKTKKSKKNKTKLLNPDIQESRMAAMQDMEAGRLVMEFLHDNYCVQSEDLSEEEPEEEERKEQGVAPAASH